MKHLFLFIALLSGLSLSAQKKPLTIADADQWKQLENIKISAAGQWVAYRIEPQVGDAHLVYHSIQEKTTDTLKRVSKYALLYQKPYIVATVQQAYADKRLLKLKKEKKENFPKDSLYLIRLKTGEQVFLSEVKGWSVPEANGDFVAYLTERSSEAVAEEVLDSVKAEAAESKSKEDEEPYLVVYNITKDQTWEFPQVTDYKFSHKGKYCTFYSIGDSLFEKGLYVLNTATGKTTKKNLEAESIEKLSTDTFENHFALLSTEDEEKADERFFNLHVFDFVKEAALVTVDSNDLILRHLISKNRSPYFTKDGKRMFFGMEKRSKKYEEDSTVLDDEKPKLDVWSHHDGRLQPEQQKKLQQDQSESLLCFMDLKKFKIRKLSKHTKERVTVSAQSTGKYALVSDPTPYHKERSWESPWARDVYLLDINTGERELLFEKLMGRALFSPMGKYVYWFNQEDGSWWLMDLKKRKRTHLNKDMPKAFANNEDDHPALPYAYGTGGWTENDAHVLLYDRFGVWIFDATGKVKPKRIGGTVENQERYRVLKKTRDPYLSLDEPLSFSVFNKKTKAQHEMTWNWERRQLSKVDQNGVMYTYYRRAAHSRMELYRLVRSGTYPELFMATPNGIYRQLSFTNPQQKKYKWYETELVEYLNTDGKPLQGVLYKPENFDPNKKYPMVVYFYEQLSDYINSYQNPRPAASTISRAFYCSNDYFVFVPDIIYKDGQPGQSAFNCIMPGVLKLLNERKYLNKDKVALQGQSWGGYQTAYLITKTDLFACGMAGAPVSNMTSAYGGIRWGSGLSRAFQYEHGQSRIGGDLWSNSRDYFENSPLFYADRVQTPLLIMHNDNDGAVPWYQGIEYYSSLRRLNKPVWMLVYNGEEHNLTQRANKVDLSHRMFGFFNYYLKDEPMPQWMKEGIPAVQKGKVLGY